MKTQSQIRLLLFVVLLAYLGQMTLNPIIAPLSREIGLAEWQVGLTISTAAVMVVLTSQFWGRRSQSWGRKPVLVSALLLATIAMTLFAFISYAGMKGALAGTALFAVFLILRGFGFGTAIAAIPPTAQAYIADNTDDEESRVKGMAGIGAAQGIAMILGATAGGLLAAFGLMVPIIIVPILLFLGLLLVVFALRKEAKAELVEFAAKVSPRDPRVWPFLLCGFGMFTSLGFIQVIAGFILQDRFDLNTETTGLMTGLALLAAGIGMVIAQSVIVPKSKWSPIQLLRNGSVVALLGFLILIPNAAMWVVFVSMAAIGVGLGIATPGYTAGPTLKMDKNEQGGLAGLVGATNGLTFVIAPTASTVLYGIAPQLPIAIGAVCLGAVAAFVWFGAPFRRLLEQGKTPTEPLKI